MDKFISVKPLDSQLKPGQKVLKSADYQQLLNYEGVLQKLSSREQQRQVDVTEQLQKSIQNGRHEGMEQANQELAQSLHNFTLRMHQSLSEVEESLVDVVIESVKKIVHGFDDEALVRNTVRSGLELVRGGKKLTVRVNPQMLSAVQEQLREFENSINHIEILPDVALKIDECILESDVGIVSASVEQQVEALVKSLRKVIF